MNKSTLRQRFRRYRFNANYHALAISDLESKCKHVTHIATYLPIQNEIDTIPFIEWALSQSKHIYIPRPYATGSGYDIAEVTNLTTGLVEGPYNIRVPHPDCAGYDPKKIELWIVPGLAFTENGARLGQGGGHYDRLLANTPGQKLGVAHRCQQSDALPQDKWDVSMDYVLFY